MQRPKVDRFLGLLACDLSGADVFVSDGSPLPSGVKAGNWVSVLESGVEREAVIAAVTGASAFSVSDIDGDWPSYGVELPVSFYGPSEGSAMSGFGLQGVETPVVATQESGVATNAAGGAQFSWTSDARAVMIQNVHATETMFITINADASSSTTAHIILKPGGSYQDYSMNILYDKLSIYTANALTLGTDFTCIGFL